MARIIMVAYRPHGQQRLAVLKLLDQQYQLVRQLGLISDREPWLMEGANGEIVYVAAFDDARHIESCWENEAFQDIDSRLSLIADMVPIRTLQEANGPYLEAEAWARPDYTIAHTLPAT